MPASASSAAPLPVAVPPRVRAWLSAAPDGPVPLLHRGPLALYVDVAGRAVGLLARGAVQVPNAVRATSASIAPLFASRSYLEQGILHVDGRPLSMGRSVEVHIPRLRHVGTSCSTANSVTFAATPPAAVAEFVVSRAPAVHLHGLRADDVPRLLGAGDGLTPLGDDVLSGWIATRRALGHLTPDVDAAVATHAHRTTTLSATLLECAHHGEAIPQLGRWLHSRGTDAEPAAAAALLAVGGSSGSGLMLGALLALDHRTAQEAVA